MNTLNTGNLTLINPLYTLARYRLVLHTWGTENDLSNSSFFLFAMPTPKEQLTVGVFDIRALVSGYSTYFLLDPTIVSIIIQFAALLLEITILLLVMTY